MDISCFVVLKVGLFDFDHAITANAAWRASS